MGVSSEFRSLRSLPQLDPLWQLESSTVGKFALPWVSGRPASTSDPRLKEDIRLASTIEGQGREKHVYVSIRAGWKEFPSYDRMTHDQRVQLSTRSAISLDQRLSQNILQWNQNAVKRTDEIISSTPVIGPLSLGDGPIVSSTLLSGMLPTITQFCKHRCAFCFDLFSSKSQEVKLDQSTDSHIRKKSKLHNPDTPMMIGVKHLVHTMCHELYSTNSFQSILDRIFSKRVIVVQDIMPILEEKNCCNICGRNGGLLCKFRLLSGTILHKETEFLGHGLCLQTLAESGILQSPSSSRFDELYEKYPCSHCGQHLGITYCCNHPSCHNRTHHICGLQAGWNIGLLDIETGSHLSKNSSNQQPSIFCYLCQEHSFS